MKTIMRSSILRIVIPLLLLASAFAVPPYRLDADVTNFLTMVSVLFAILLGFFIATATTNYLSFQTSLADEGTALIILFNLGALAWPSAKERIAEAIDRYIIATFDFSLTDYVENTNKEYDALIDLIDGLEPDGQDKRRVAELENVVQAKTDVLRARRAIAFAARRVTSATHWAVIVLLGAILVLLLFGLRDGHLLTNLVAGSSFAALYLVLLLLYEVDGNTFLEDQLAYGDAQDVFHAIGKPGYYPASALERRIVRPPKRVYRVGVYKDYPRSTEKEIRLVAPD